MYRDHCLGTIAPAMRADYACFERGFMFAVCSIRQATINVPDQLAVLFDNAEGENPLFGHKFKAWEYLGRDGRLLWDKLNLFYALGTRHACEAALEAITEVPGLGLVKGGFILQLMGFDIACLDSRNVAREKRNPRAFRSDGKKISATKRKAYMRATYGKAARYWDAWCRDVAEAYGRTPEQISELHLAIVPAQYVPF